MTPFAFDTLKNFPTPTRSLVIALSVVVFSYILRDAFILPHMATLVFSRSDLTVLHLTERGATPHRPEILIAGSSINGMGLSTEVLEKQLHHPVAKITCTAGSPWECLEILKKYAFECRHARLVVVDLDPSRLQSLTPALSKTYRKDRFLYFGDPTTMRIPGSTVQANWDEMVLPLRISVRQLRRLRANPRKRIFENVWNENRPIDQQPELYAMLRERENTARKERTLPSSEQDDCGVPAKSFREPVHQPNEEMMQTVLRLVDYCGQRNIHLVFNVLPAWYGNETTLPETDPDPHNQEYWTFMKKLDAFPHCTVIVNNTLEEISPGCAYEQCYFDGVHLTRHGSTIYSQWFAEHLQNRPEVVAALETPRTDSVKANSFLAETQKNLRTVWTVCRSALLATPPTSETPAPQSVQVASPTRDLQR